MNEYIQGLFTNWLPCVLNGSGVRVPDDPKEMNWHIFFGHSQDMQGFRADIFTGGLNEEERPPFRGLRRRWTEDHNGNSFSLIADLARLWEDGPTRQIFIRITDTHRPIEERRKGIQPALDLLLQSGAPGARVFAETLCELRGNKIARKTNMMVRAYVQNSHLLAKHGCSFRAYLQSIAPNEPFPPVGIPEAEKQWTRAIQRDYYNVGSAIANYMICDWLLGFWLEGRIDWFSSYKCDSVQQGALKDLLSEAAGDFVAYCETLRIPEGYGIVSGKPCPPRVLNECIWLDRNASSRHP